MKIAFLLYNAYGIGGTIRAAANLGAALSAAGHTVELVSVYQTQDRPRLEMSPELALRPLIEWRKGEPGCARKDPAARRRSVMFPDGGLASGPLAPSRLTDERVADYLRRTDADVVIGTRPVLNGYLARYGESRYLRIGQEHLTLEMHKGRQRAGVLRSAAELDAYVTVTEVDAERYRAALPKAGTPILCIPNVIPPARARRPERGTRTIVAAGRLTGMKRYDRLIDAFALVADEYPDWSLRIYGRGDLRDKLRRQVVRLDLCERIRLMGPVVPIETEWAKAEIACVTSDREPFGLTIVEAMHCGVPVIATDCPHGPGEIITQGADGLLVPLEGGAEAYADALRILMSNEDKRRAMGDEARVSAGRYAPALIADRYLRLFEELREAPPRSRGLLSRLRSARRARRDEAPALPAPPPRTEVLTDGAAPARCAVSPDGSPVVELAADRLPSGPLDLLLRLRDDPDGAVRRVPLPSPDAAVDGRVGVEIDRELYRLAEGRWDVFLAPRSGREDAAPIQRLPVELVEQAELVGVPPRETARGVSAWIPYATSGGHLGLRVWQRPAHVEVREVAVSEDDGGSMAVVAEPLGDVVTGPGATVRAVLRGADGVDVVVDAECTADGGVRFTLPYRPLLDARRSERDLWSLRLVPAPGAAEVPLGRIGGDIADRKQIDMPRGVRLEDPRADVTAGVQKTREQDEAAERRVRVRPYFTAGHGLGLSVRGPKPVRTAVSASRREPVAPAA
ncbi:glycosyltransferase family 4 protein [Streptomyces sp. OF3]|uniref:D-inositol 3-phosphate glycosyltransferase n=1 Tax=Streptomyces alkaliterrae TaxID=2213162 RepID=A0A7W3WMI9_9ACTN|nr:glycosyltransferase [Streptomyces alkaliterrae]MBB1255109.1 glycosyltransferase family 4 protein [Streptomyces alkaliterrae]